MPRLVQGEIPKRTVINKAQQVRNTYFGENDTPQEVFVRLIENLGGRIEFCDGDDREETLRVFSEDNFVIFLPWSSSGARDNFTIAHELGHYFLHTDFVGDEVLRHTRRGSNRREWEANWFAAELLMPSEIFIKAANEYDNNEMLLSLKFGVSPAAANVRMSALGIKQCAVRQTELKYHVGTPKFCW